jgi:hypothetical protein
VPVRVRLTRKFAEALNGIDLSRAKAGEELELSEREAELLVAEGWALPLDTADDTPKGQHSRRKKPQSSRDPHRRDK